jgi:hypothetical protein
MSFQVGAGLQNIRFGKPLGIDEQPSLESGKPKAK